PATAGARKAPEQRKRSGNQCKDNHELEPEPWPRRQRFHEIRPGADSESEDQRRDGAGTERRKEPCARHNRKLGRGLVSEACNEIVRSAHHEPSKRCVMAARPR